jgi:hypothetical protein
MQPLDQPLLDLLFDRLAADGVSGQQADLVLAAYAGDAQLATALAGGSPSLPAGPGDAPPSAPTTYYLESVTVAGFRGIGPSTSLRLRPNPGLTLIVGRNGSGKSSFAEAAELSLTGTSPRWSGGLSSVFKDGLRNLHQGSPCQVQVAVRADGQSQAIQITRTWREGENTPEQASTSVVTAGQRYSSVAELGWETALDVYRPFLSADDVGRLISARPSGLFDALAPILGLEPLTAADKRLMDARKEVDGRLKQLRADREGLRSLLAGVDDDRARSADAILAKQSPDLHALDEVLARTEERGGDPVAAACRRLADAPLPSPEDVLAIAERLADASGRAALLASGEVHSAQQVAGLLEAALAFHADHGDGLCPVCRTGTLDAVWRAQATEALNQRNAEAAQARAAAQQRDAAFSDARGLWARTSLPTTEDLQTAEHAIGTAAPGLSTALAAWQSLAPGASTVPSAGARGHLPPRLSGSSAAGLAPESLAEQIRLTYPALHESLAIAREAARDWLAHRHDTWREPAALVQGWLLRAREQVGDRQLLASITSARTWLKTATEVIRNERLAPFAKRSQQVWEQLRQESNVELGGMRLDGSSTSRRLSFPATVDGTPAQAMAVMSQGELQALGLAVFLPRASADESPFRFVIIDDPVHSMDPAKVEGLAQALQDLSADRQVIVFTHDNRLSDAIRRLQIDATIWEVVRRQRSAVDIRRNDDPVTRYLKDALDLALTTDLTDEVRWPVVAGCCRSAIEAACHERILCERLSRGEPLADVEALIDSTRGLYQVVALALFGDSQAGGQVLVTLNRRFGGWAGDAFLRCQRLVHGEGMGTARDLVKDTQRLVEGLR